VTWRQPTNLCERRDEGTLAIAAAVLVASLDVAVDSALRLDALRHVGIAPVAPHVTNYDRETWSLLHTMLVEERRLMEFLLGPRTDKTGLHRQPDDICVTCFSKSPEGMWRLPQQHQKIFRERMTRINKRLAHFAWVLTEDDPRTVVGTWQTGYLREVAEQLWSFREWLTAQRPAAAAAMYERLSEARHRAALLPAPGLP